jgi:hypothetical protein
MGAADDAVDDLCGAVVSAARDKAEAIIAAVQADDQAQITDLTAQLAASDQRVNDLTAQTEADAAAAAQAVATIAGLNTQHDQDTAAVKQANADKAAAQAATAKVQAAFDAYVKSHPDTPAPAALALFGARCGPDAPNVYVAGDQARVTNLLGGRLGVERIFNIANLWAVPTSTAKSIILSVEAPVADTIAGKLDSQHVALMKACSAKWANWYYSPLVQEPDLPSKGISPADSRAAVEHVIALAAANGIRGVNVQAIVTSVEAQGGVDVAAYCSPKSTVFIMDAYSNNGIAKVNTLPKAYAYARAAADKLGIGPLVFAETAVRPYTGLTDTQHAQLVADGIAWLKDPANRVAAAAWFFSNKAGTKPNEADWRLTPWVASLAAWRAATIASVAS